LDENLVRSLSSGGEIDLDLRVIIERWNDLPVDLRQAIVRLVQ
jgi:hypothetical protein